MGKVLGIYGAGGLGREIFELANLIQINSNRWDSIIYIDDYTDKKMINDTGVFSYNDAKNTFNRELEFVIALGEPIVRKTLADKVSNDGFKLATLIHPNVNIPKTTSIGQGTIVSFGDYISCDVMIGDNVLIQPNANVGHDTVIKSNSVVSSLCNLAGGTCLGECSYLGMSVSVKEKVSIGDNSIVGMGSMVFKDMPDEIIAMGNPARPMKKNDEGRVFK